jgi:hypothetical protein
MAGETCFGYSFDHIAAGDSPGRRWPSAFCGGKAVIAAVKTKSILEAKGHHSTNPLFWTTAFRVREPGRGGTKERVDTIDS